MTHLHDLATTIGNSSLLGIFSALAAGLAALALISGVAKVRGGAVPQDFPGDAEAQLDKYIVPFNQLDQVSKDNATGLSELAANLKNQPAAHLGLTAFQRFTASKKATLSPKSMLKASNKKGQNK